MAYHRHTIEAPTLDILDRLVNAWLGGFAECYGAHKANGTYAKTSGDVTTFCQDVARYDCE